MTIVLNSLSGKLYMSVSLDLFEGFIFFLVWMHSMCSHSIWLFFSYEIRQNSYLSWSWRNVLMHVVCMFSVALVGELNINWAQGEDFSGVCQGHCLEENGVGFISGAQVKLGLLLGCAGDFYIGRGGTRAGGARRCSEEGLAGQPDDQALFSLLPLHWQWERVGLCVCAL